jgi:DNA-binding IclR family transcriptional regulator
MPTAHSVLPNRRRSSILSGLDALECLAASSRPLSLGEVAAQLEMAKSSVHELLGALTMRGYVQRGSDMTYVVGAKAWEVGCRASFVELGRVAEPYLAELVREVQEGASLAVLDGVHTVCIQIAESPQVVRVHSGVGERNPAHCVSTGLAMLATLGDRELASLFPAQLPILTSKSLSTREDLLREIQRVREHGYAVCKGAWHLDVAGVAAAIPGANGRAAAAVSVALPRQRLTAARQTALAAALMRTTQAIASQLDGRTQAASLPPATPPSTRRR